MSETFGIASFRSRQQVLKFDGALRREGIHTAVVTTPRDVAMGCGLSIRFDVEDYERVREVYARLRPSNLIGFYRITNDNGRHVSTQAM